MRIFGRLVGFHTWGVSKKGWPFYLLKALERRFYVPTKARKASVILCLGIVGGIRLADEFAFPTGGRRLPLPKP